MNGDIDMKFPVITAHAGCMNTEPNTVDCAEGLMKLKEVCYHR
jgi:hypothetical protein